MHRMRVGVCIFIVLFTASCISKNPHYNAYLSHHGEKGFHNPQVAERMKKRGMMRWLKDVAVANTKVNSLKSLPEVVTLDTEKIYNPDPEKIQVTWVGHSTFLIQMNGYNFLTDPIFSDRASPVPFIGPRRHVPVGIEFNQLPPIDYVFISHNHYDHLDVSTVRRLGNKVTYLVPLGVKRWFEDRQVDAIILEKDWWDTSKVSGFRMTFVPAQHFSGRIIFDLNKTLWGGWVIERAEKKVYFAGDTGYTKEFKELGGRMGPMDVSLIPIGAYAPRDTLKFVHADPFDAVKIHQDVKSKQSIATHWGTFRLTTEPMGEPKKLLQKAVKEQGLAPESFTTMSIGETRAY